MNEHMKALEDFGTCIRNLSFSANDILSGEKIVWTSKVYRKRQSYIKMGTPWLIDNEMRFLEKIGDGDHFPKLISSGHYEEFHWIEVSEMQGEELFNNKWSISLAKIRSYALKILDSLENLYRHNIMHRDIHTGNILVDKNGNISILDFGMAIDFRKDKSIPCPDKLGLGYAPPYMYSDFYSLASLYEHRWKEMPFVAHFSSELKKIDWEHYQDSEFVFQQIERTRNCLYSRYTLIDIWEFILGKYKVRKYIRHPKKFLKRIMPSFNVTTSSL